MTEAQARRIVRQAYQPGHALVHNPMHRGGGRSDLTLPLPRSMLSPQSGGGLLRGTTVSDSFPRHELTGSDDATPIVWWTFRCRVPGTKELRLREWRVGQNFCRWKQSTGRPACQAC